MEILQKLIQMYHLGYNKAQLKAIESILGDENYFRKECTFFDNGRVEAGIKEIQADYQKLTTEIEFLKKARADDGGTKEKLQYLYTRQRDMMHLMCYQASQNIKNIDECIQMAESVKYDFLPCLKALEAYYDGRYDEAERLLAGYLKSHVDFGTHYLVNKVWATLMFQRENYREATRYALRAVDACPEDAEIHHLLLELGRCGNIQRIIDDETKIIQLLEA